MVAALPFNGGDSGLPDHDLADPQLSGASDRRWYVLRRGGSAGDGTGRVAVSAVDESRLKIICNCYFWGREKRAGNGSGPALPALHDENTP